MRVTVFALLAATTLAATIELYCYIPLYVKNEMSYIGFFMAFQGFGRVAIIENALFKYSGIINNFADHHNNIMMLCR